MKFLSFLSVLLLLTVAISVQGQLKDNEIINFTAEDGLPSNECHDIVQDSLGYIWIATDRGLSRFDGYGFKNYGKKEGLGDLSCLRLYLDKSNNIWISTFGKKIYRYESYLDTIVPYEYNHLLELYYNKTAFVFLQYIDENDVIYFESLGAGIFSIDKGGILCDLTPSDVGYGTFYSVELDGAFLFSSLDWDFTDEFKMSNDVTKFYKNKLRHENVEIEIPSNRKQKVFGNGKAYRLFSNQYLYSVDGNYYFFDNNKLTLLSKRNEIEDILITERGQFLTAQIFKQGVKLFQDYAAFKSDKFDYVLKDVSATRFLSDQQNNIFISTLEDGIFYFKRKAVQTVDLGLCKDRYIANLALGNKHHLLMTESKKSVIDLNVQTGKIKERYRTHNEINDLQFNTHKNELYIAAQISHVLMPDENLKTIIFNEARYGSTYGFKRIISLYNNKYLALGSKAFGIYSDLKILPDFCSEGVMPYQRFLCGTDSKSGGYLLGSYDGIYHFRDKSLSKLDDIHPILNDRINDIRPMGNLYVVGTQGEGIAIWDGKKEVFIIQKTDGILTDNIEKIYVDNPNQIYLCSKAGLTKITFESAQNYHITNYTRHHGLPSNIVNDVIRMGDSLYIATAKGLCVLAAEPQKETARSAIIEIMTVNNRPFKFKHLPNKLSYQENSITFQYKSLDLSMRGDIPYRTRLNSGKWLESKSTSINYASLEPGKYSFQVQAANKDLEWSPIVKHDFEIKKPWWQTTLFRFSGFLFIGFLGYSLYKTRIRQLQKENKIQKELTALERSALQAQMNPHFIFNCLNSINASTKDLVTLEDEISMLTNYLHLEQMLFNHSFDYQFQIAENMDLTEINLPPLLIQPFVENAVLHGMSGIKSGGLITINVHKKDKELHITVKDNGKGFSKSKSQGMHRSLGISITQKRLQYINDHADGNYNISTQSDESGTEIGIILKI